MTDPLTTPERIAFAGDWHENAEYAARAIRHAKNAGADVLIQLGDFGYNYGRHFLALVSAAAMYQRLPVLFIDGNHENFPKLHSYPIGADGLREVSDWVWHLPRGFRWEWSGIRFLALGGAHSVDRPWRQPGLSWWKDEAITEEQAAQAISGGPTDVLIAHDCPIGVDIPGLQPDAFPPLEILRAEEHRGVLRRVVEAVRPQWIWHGHYHQQYGQTVDLGYGPVTAVGLDCDGSDLRSNVQVVTLANLVALQQATAPLTFNERSTT
uniref:metallophosphoesterase family protein n=1 Tax=Paractinoplanes polyasparticus TaxID=2856853 RepID=UPI001C845808|nr:metallophosphoesterase [Actinoplanes polyasparticus]